MPSRCIAEGPNIGTGDTKECMFLLCHVHASEWIHTVVTWMSRNFLVETGMISEV